MTEMNSNESCSQSFVHDTESSLTYRVLYKHHTIYTMYKLEDLGRLQARDSDTETYSFSFNILFILLSTASKYSSVVT